MATSMMSHLHAAALTGFAIVMAAAAFEDFRRLVIPNLLPLLLCALWPLYFAAGPSWYGAVAAIGCAAAVFCGGAILFARGWLGGGDVKLLTAAALWAGPETPSLLMLTSVLGGALALFLLLPFGRQMLATAQAKLGRPPVQAGRGLAMPVPYGIAIAGAALIVTLPHFG